MTLDQPNNRFAPGTKCLQKLIHPRQDHRGVGRSQRSSGVDKGAGHINDQQGGRRRIYPFDLPPAIGRYLLYPQSGLLHQRIRSDVLFNDLLDPRHQPLTSKASRPILPKVRISKATTSFLQRSRQAPLYPGNSTTAEFPLKSTLYCDYGLQYCFSQQGGILWISENYERE